MQPQERIREVSLLSHATNGVGAQSVGAAQDEVRSSVTSGNGFADLPADRVTAAPQMHSYVAGSGLRLPPNSNRRSELTQHSPEIGLLAWRPVAAPILEHSHSDARIRGEPLR